MASEHVVENELNGYIECLAEEWVGHFTLQEEEDWYDRSHLHGAGPHIWLAKEAPEDLRALLRVAHGPHDVEDGLWDRWRLRFVRDALGYIYEHGAGSLPHVADYSTRVQRPPEPVGKGELVSWLTSHKSRREYCDLVLGEWSTEKQGGIDDLFRLGYLKEAGEVSKEVLRCLIVLCQTGPYGSPWPTKMVESPTEK